ncbi:hypothetical protein GCM10011505_02990 [Tistrella bauzanensis]|uniref:Ribbon-helix-helix protein CopG domain-containing protein n=1 Tax=Tistrella bauzanensis TaxID=657419 RepID=A0ABQ1I7R5_9PROT|nr:ribbon-helix-helix protein, CopG family [Tistrella bauzanensis]GGB25189.1 hypothetical protein GCM10011505_02990 [Tistrella bauzanensis]
MHTGPNTRSGHGHRKTETVSFRLDSALKTRLTELARRDQKSLGDVLRDLARHRVALTEDDAIFASEVDRQSRLIAARAQDPQSAEAEMMQWIDAAADTQGWQ